MPRRLPLLLAVLIAALVTPVAALADVSPPGDIPDNQAFVPYAGRGYSLVVPEGWARVSAGGVTTFHHAFLSVRLERRSAPTPPTRASVLRSEIPRLRSSEPGFSRPTVTTVQRHAGPVLLITYRARSAVDAVTGRRVAVDVQRYLYWRAGRSVAVSLAGPVGADNVDAFRRITDSFRWR